MKLQLLGSLVVAALAFSSCDDTTNDIGSGLTNNVDKLEITTDTFTVSTRSIVADSVLARNSTAYLGKIRDPETGAYITNDCMIQFHALEDYTQNFPIRDSVASKLNGEIIADSCDIRLFYTKLYGDSLAAMKLTAYEMGKPMEEGVKYYSNFDPLKEGYVRTDGLQADQTYTLTDLSVSEKERRSKNYTPSIRIRLDKEYIDKDGTVYNNYGTYVMRNYYKNPANFKNSYRFIHNVVPGFFLKSQSGLGSMAYVTNSQLNIYLRYKTKIKSSKGKVDSLVTVPGAASFVGTEEVLQKTTVTNDRNTITKLAADNTCTYLKTPSGIFTEITIPVEEIMAKHQNDTINSAKIVLTRINNTVQSDYALKAPETLLIIPKDSLYSFFENNRIANNKNSFLATYDKATSYNYNTYTFNNISGMVSAMYKSGKKSSNWNKAVIIPVSTTYVTSKDASGNDIKILTRVVHDMSMTSTKLVGGSQNTNSPVTIKVIYSRFK